MMKSLIILLLILSFNLFGQDKTNNQNVELPDFIITGKNILNIKKANKSFPKVISIISNDFLQSKYSAENLQVADDNIGNIDPLKYKKKINNFNGSLTFKSGVYNLPSGNFFIASPFKYGIFNFKLNGANIREHVSNSDESYINGSAKVSFFVNNDSGILPGTKITLFTKYGTHNYKFYATSFPKERKLKKSKFLFNIQNLLNDHFIFSTEIFNDYHNAEDAYLTENVLNIRGFTKISLSDFDVATNILYKKQFLGNVSYNYFFANPRANFNFVDKFKFSLGFTYSHVTGNDYYTPYASVSIGLAKNLILVGEYAPKADFITAGTLLDDNKYFSAFPFRNLFFKKTNSLDISLKYEYKNYFIMEYGLNFYKTTNQPYYKIFNLSGGPTPDILLPNDASFTLSTTSANSYSGYFKFILNPGEYGKLSALIKYNKLEDLEGNRIPYSPLFTVNILYGYNINQKIYAETNIKFNSSSFIDITNTNALNSFVDFGIKIKYKYNKQVNFFVQGTNLTDNANFHYSGYKELPISVLVGVDIKF